MAEEEVAPPTQQDVTMTQVTSQSDLTGVSQGTPPPKKTEHDSTPAPRKRKKRSPSAKVSKFVILEAGKSGGGHDDPDPSEEDSDVEVVASPATKKRKKREQARMPLTVDTHNLGTLSLYSNIYITNQSNVRFYCFFG